MSATANKTGKMTSDFIYLLNRSEPNMNRIILFSSLLVILSSCNSWVQVTSEGESVRLASGSETANCQRVGSAQAQTLSRLVVVERGGERLQDELIRLARNEAGDLGGNVIVPESVIEEGRQSFGVYRCPD